MTLTAEPCGHAPAESLLIGGLTPFSTVDWPGTLACVVFLAGCPWRCPYCHNYLLRDATEAHVSWGEVESFLLTRQGLLDAVVFSGGEPLAQEGLVDAAKRVKKMGYTVGLHTAGVYPKRLAAVVPQLDWVGFDVKAPWKSYQKITKRAGSEECAQQSLQLLLDAGIDMEARTTWHPDLLTPEDLVAIGHELASRGVQRWAIQAYRPQGSDGSLPSTSPSPSDVPEEARRAVPTYEFRRA